MQYFLSLFALVSQTIPSGFEFPHSLPIGKNRVGKFLFSLDSFSLVLTHH